MEPGTEVVQKLFTEIAAQSPQEIRQSIMDLQEAIAGMPEALDVSVCPLKHTFVPGCYAREITMPTGIVVVGRIHKHEHLNVISKGRCRVLTEFGTEELVAPCTFVSRAGTKRVVHVLEETVWTTFHLTNETDVDKIVKEVTAESYDEIELVGECYRVEDSA